MKKYLLQLYTILFIITYNVCMSAELHGPAPLTDNEAIDLTKHIKLGEELDYLANWTGFPAGTIKTRVWKGYKTIKGQDHFLFEATITANDFLSIFYPVKSILRSYPQASTGYSAIFTRKVIEGDYRANDRVDYDYEYKDSLGDNKPKIKISLIRNNSVEEADMRNIPGKISDPLSILWLIRGLDFQKIGTRKSILIGDRFTNGIITLTLLAIETINIPDIGKFKCLVIKPEASTYGDNQNLLQVEGNAKIWLEFNSKILLRAEADLPIGKASAIITAYKNTTLDNYKLPQPEED